MRKRRFFFLFALSVVLCVGLACGQLAQKPPPSPTLAVAPTVAPVEQPTEPALPPETAAIVASAGPDGLYQPPRGDVRLVAISDLNAAYGSTDYDPEVDKGIALLPFWQPDMRNQPGHQRAWQPSSSVRAKRPSLVAHFAGS